MNVVSDSVARPGRATPVTSTLARLAGAAALGVLSLSVGFAAARAPILALTVAIGLSFFGLACGRFSTAVAILIASFFFNGYLTSGGTQIVTLEKGVGLVAALAWGLEWIRRRRSTVWDPGVPISVSFLLWALFSAAVAESLRASLVDLTRYLSFVGLFFLTVQAVGGDHRRARVLANVAVVAASVSAAIGMIRFFTGATPRASGPLPDANDFGVLLATMLPLALLARQRAATLPDRALTTVAVLLLSLTIAGTLSRSALSGLAVAGTWAWTTGRLRVSLRLALTVLSVAAFLGLLAFRLEHNQVQNALLQKQHTASTNVESRFESWAVALREFSASPVLGVGTGNFAKRYHEFVPSAGLTAGLVQTVPVTHSVYLSILAELGLPGVAIFVGFLGYSWSRLRRRLPDPDTDGFQSAIAAGFLVAVVAGFFLNEQYYMQLWFLPALGATLPSRRLALQAPLAQGEPAPAASPPPRPRATALDQVR